MPAVPAVIMYSSHLSPDARMTKDEVQQRTVSLGNTMVELDLTAEEAKTLDDFLAPYLEKGKKVTKPRGTRRTRTTGSSSRGQTIYDKMGLDREEKNDLLHSLRVKKKITEKQKRVKPEVLEPEFQAMYPEKYDKWVNAGKPGA